jgi:two-component system, chemotaxis family, response regulator Rcp1
MDRGQPIHIFIAERDAAHRAGALHLLTRAKIHNRLEIVPDGQTLLDLLRQAGTGPGQELPDVVLMGLNMPKKDGPAVLAEMRSDPKLKDIPVVFLTGGPKDEQRLQSPLLAGNPSIPLPLTLDKLLHTLAHQRPFWVQIETDAAE